MHVYNDVTTRFLRNDERLVFSAETEMPLVIEADQQKDAKFLKDFLTSHSPQILDDIAKYGAVLLRGFDIQSDEEFEKTILSIQGLRGISEAFMSEHGRVRVGDLKYVLHTNAVYQTGGTFYLGGFHSENYYVPDVPSYICFFCIKPSELGGETGLVNMGKVYEQLDNLLKNKLEKNPYFVAKWLVSEVADRYGISEELVEEICNQFGLPIVGDTQKFILMYKPNVFEHPVTKKRALQINFFELPKLNIELQKCFLKDYQGKKWFWHRFFWRMPSFLFKSLETCYMGFKSLLYSPLEFFKILKSKLYSFIASKKLNKFNDIRVNDCFEDEEIKELAKLIRHYYSSCLWKKSDILLVDNRQVVHTGMPGTGKRLLRAMICNPIDIQYAYTLPGFIECKNRMTETIGFYMTSAVNAKLVEEKISI